jgi:hypothetical protein
MLPDRAFGFLTGADREDIERGEARNGLIHIISLALTKTVDGRNIPIRDIAGSGIDAPASSPHDVRT